MTYYISGTKSLCATSFEKRLVSKEKNWSYLNGTLTLAKESTFYPNRSDEKIMRTDVIAAVIATSEIIEELNLRDITYKIPLFVANGTFIENDQRYIKRLEQSYKSFTANQNSKDRNRKIYMGSPPLVALETLTNLTMSFVAQYVGFRSNNATFGNTSLSGYQAIEKAVSYLNSNENSVAISSNGAGDYSFISNSFGRSNKIDWKESAAVSCMVLSKDANESLARVTTLNYSKSIPSIFYRSKQYNWSDLMPSEKPDCIVHSGAFTTEEYINEKNYCSSLCNKTYSLFEQYGNMGASNVFIGIDKAISLLRENSNLSAIDVVDQDVYGRECLIRIERVE